MSDTKISDVRLAAAQERINAYHPQPAELAEQQGVGELHAELLARAENLERMAAGDRETGESIEQAVESGEGYTPDDAVDVAAGLQHGANSAEETAALLRKAASALAATGKQQVGEVQGDAATHDKAADLISRLYMARDMQRAGAWSYLFAEAADALAAIAARQPGAQEPEVEFQCRLMDVKTDLPTENWHHSPTYEENPGRGTHYWVQYRKRYIYYTQPAQGIDLGQQRPLIARSLAEWSEEDGNVMWWAWCGRDWAGEPAWCGTPNDSDWPGYHTHWTQHPAKPALIDQRDAAPGVGS